MRIITDPRMLRVSVSNSFLVPILTLAVLTLFIPFLITEHSIYTTQYIYGLMIVPIFGMWFVDFVSVSHNHTKLFDWLMTIVILSLCPIPIIIGLIALLIIFLFPRTVYFTVWLVASVTVFMLGAIPVYLGEMPKKGSAFVLIANHGSFLDYFFVPLMMGYKNPWKVVYGKNLEKYPILSYFLKKYGIGVDRSSAESRQKAKEDIKQALIDGFSLMIFPEGTRMRSHQKSEVLLEFHNGAFTAAVGSKKRIIPVTLSLPILYSRPDHPLPLSPRRITMTFGKPLSSEGVSAQTLKEQSYQVIWDQLLISK